MKLSFRVGVGFWNSSVMTYCEIWVEVGLLETILAEVGVVKCEMFDTNGT